MANQMLQISRNSTKISQGNPQNVITIVSIIFIVGIIANLIFGFLITRNITQSLGKAVKIAEEVSAGNLTTQVEAVSVSKLLELLQLALVKSQLNQEGENYLTLVKRKERECRELLSDRLTDFDVNQDYLDFSALLDSLNYNGSNPVTDGYVSWRTLGTGTLISVDSDGTAGRGVARPFITLDGVISSALTSNNFVF
jgi:hypothetical protein